MKLPLPFLVAALALASVAGLDAENPSSQTQYYNPTPTPAPGHSPAPSRATPAPARKTPPPATATPKPARTAVSEPPATPRPVATPALVKHDNVNDIARFIAGLPPERDAQLTALAKTAEWTAYAAYMNNEWPHFDHIKLEHIRLWSGKEFAKKRIGTVFYPFSGPDFIYAATFFPQAPTYILCGLEPVGDVPSVDKLQPLGTSLGWLQASFKTLFNAGYFVTSDMSVELKASPLQGTVPLMCVMLARSGDRITSISTGPGTVEIRFVPPKGRERTLIYSATDLSNAGLRKGGALLDLLAKTHANTALVKSASFLMHEDEFSAVRNLLLSNFSIIVQDDSGIPLRNFDTARWTLELHGAYAAPLDIFAKYKQPDLAELYARTKDVPPLNFGFGYHWNYAEANLLVATAKPPGKQPAAAPPATSQPHK